jgi:hypothetical protein
MIAIVEYSFSSYGCQNNDGRMIDWVGGSVDNALVVEFSHDPRLSDTVNAIKHLPELYQYYNSVSFRYAYKVTILPI